jgi:hypothetical protein
MRKNGRFSGESGRMKPARARNQRSSYGQKAVVPSLFLFLASSAGPRVAPDAPKERTREHFPAFEFC